MADKARHKSAIVIGAGAGGVATAARLAKAGFQVTVVEKNGFTGGRCSLLHHGDHRWDQGPSLLLLPRLFHETFRDFDTSLEAEGIQLVKCEPNYNIWFGDGKSFELSTDLVKMKLEIEKWEGKDGFERYLAFLQEAHRHYELSMAHVMRKNFTSLLSLLRPAVVRNILKLHIIESVYTRASKYFLTERLRRVFTFASMYMGMSPFDAFGAYSLLQYTDLAEGIWYPVGGFHKVIDGLTNIGERLGVKYRLNTNAASIQLSGDGRTATGIKLANGEELTADIVICNADLVWAYNNLLPSTSYGKSLTKRETSCSSISFYWALDRVVPELKAHNIFLADAYKESFESIFKEHLIPEEPSFYVNVPSRVDPSAAAADRDTVVVLVPVGHLIDSDSSIHKATPSSPTTSQDWPKMRQIARQKVLDTIKARLGVDLSPFIVHEAVNDPPTWKETFNLDRGGILGLSHSFFNMLCFRPKTRHQSIRGLYFVGASTHPGTGVPVCLAGAKLVSQQILDDNGVAVPWSERGLKVDNTGKGIDRIHTGSGRYLLALLATIGVVLSGVWRQVLSFISRQCWSDFALMTVLLALLIACIFGFEINPKDLDLVRDW